MALSNTDLKKGTVFQLEGVPFKVIEYSQKVLGRGGSIVNVKVKNLLDGAILDKTFKGSEQITPASIETQNVQFLYKDSNTFYFINQKTFEQFEVSTSLIGDQAGFLIEGDTVMAQFFEGSIIGIELPKNVYLKVEYTEDVVKGDTTSSIQKNAKLETGLNIKVPAFIKIGDVVSVDTNTGAYRERKKD